MIIGILQKSVFPLILIYFSYFPDVIHTVGPRGEKPKVLQNAYQTSLNLMLEHGLKTIVSSID